MLHIDSHTDTNVIDERYPIDAGVQFTHAAREQRISTSASYHLGLRGTAPFGKVLDYGREMGFNLVTLAELFRRGPDVVLAEVHDKIGNRPLYLSWDMDVFDPSCAPGVCTPVWGGLSAREGLDLIRALAGLNIVAADVNTVFTPTRREWSDRFPGSVGRLRNAPARHCQRRGEGEGRDVRVAGRQGAAVMAAGKG